MVGVVILVVARLDCERAEVGRVRVRGKPFATEASGISAGIVACTSCARFLVEKARLLRCRLAHSGKPVESTYAKGGGVID